MKIALTIILLFITLLLQGYVHGLLDAGETSMAEANDGGNDNNVNDSIDNIDKSDKNESNKTDGNSDGSGGVLFSFLQSIFEYDTTLSYGSDVQFRLFTRSHPLKAVDMLIYNTTVETDYYSTDWLDDFRDSKKVVVVTHGFKGSGDGEMSIQIRDAYLYKYDLNLIVVHWENLARYKTITSYETAVNNTGHVARLVARLVDYIVQRTPTTTRDFHLIGFSLGAHVMGQAGHMVAGGKVGRITGLDPAKPLFDRKPLSQRLDASDALFVDVIHTEMQLLAFKNRLGHVDVYPNGGMSPQPACVGLPSMMLCSHRMSWRYYAAAIYHPQLCEAERCDSWQDYKHALTRNDSCPWAERAVMGPEIDTRARGMFFLHTLVEAPYCDDRNSDNTTQNNCAWNFYCVEETARNDGKSTAITSAAGRKEVIFLIYSGVYFFVTYMTDEIRYPLHFILCLYICAVKLDDYLRLNDR